MRAGPVSSPHSDVPFLRRQFAGLDRRHHRRSVAAARRRLQAERRCRLRRDQLHPVAAATRVAADCCPVQPVGPAVGAGDAAAASVAVDGVAEHEEQYDDAGRDADDEPDV